MSIFSSLLVHRLNWIWTHILFLIIRNLFYGREVFLSCVKMINCDLIHSDIHDRAMSSVSSLAREVRLAYMRCTVAHIRVHTHNATRVLFLDFLGGLKDRRKQTLILHEWTIMVVFSNSAYSTYYTRSNIVFKVAVESLVLAVIYLEIGKLTTTMLCCQWPFLHIDIVILFLLLRINICSSANSNTASGNIVAILVVKRAVWSIIRYLAHTLRIYRHGFMSTLGHSKYLTHLRRSWSSTVYTCL